MTGGSPITDTVTRDYVAELAARMARLSCDYFEGMFANEPRVEHTSEFFGNLADHIGQREATQHHEAGHAVLMYALGLGCAGVSLTLETKHLPDGSRTTAYSGCANRRKTWVSHVGRLINRGSLTAEVIAEGVAFAAGAAAERKYRLSANVSLSMLGATESDHHRIEGVAKTLQFTGGHDRYAYEEMVWSRAQQALEIDVIWNAVEALAESLRWPWEADEVGVFTETMAGPTARAIMRRLGVRPGILDSLLVVTKDQMSSPRLAPARRC